MEKSPVELGPGPTATFWKDVTEDIKQTIAIGNLRGKTAGEADIIANAARKVWINLMTEKYCCRERFQCLNDFISAARQDKDILEVLPGEFPDQCIIRTSNLEWVARNIFSHNRSRSLIDISVKGSDIRWFGAYCEGVLESINIMKEIDGLIPSIRAIIGECRTEVSRQETIRSIESTTSETLCLPYERRRDVDSDGFSYLVDDINGTAWIHYGRVLGTAKYRIPDTVVIEGEKYRVTSIEAGAYDHCIGLEELVVPDGIEYLDEDSFQYCTTLGRVLIGKGLKSFHTWAFKGCPIREIIIDPENPHIRASEDGATILSKDGTRLLATVRDIRVLRIPEGVTELEECAISCLNKLRRIIFPSTLKTIGPQGIWQNSKLEEIILPQGVCELGTQALSCNGSLKVVDLPEGIHTLDERFVTMADKLTTLVLRSRIPVLQKGLRSIYDILPTSGILDSVNDSCRLYVPKDLVDSYKDHPLWASFKEILPIEEKEQAAFSMNSSETNPWSP